MLYDDADVRDVGRALAREVAEHGAPNSFSPGELHSRYHVPVPLVLGRIGRENNVLLLEIVRERHPTVTGVSYHDRAFHVYGEV